MEISAAASLVTSQPAQTFNTPATSSDNDVREVRRDGDADNAARRTVQQTQSSGTTTTTTSSSSTLGSNVNVTA
ncbi:MAG TPA: hypothetical protein ENI62_08010 [Gammaproteobacteria bacterium]|nr:hypothetical protein [Gammaproteobacteria bacterium]